MLKSCNLWSNERENKKYNDVMELLLLQQKQRNERAAPTLSGIGNMTVKMGQDEGLCSALHCAAAHWQSERRESAKL